MGWGALHSERLIIDVTVRHPVAKKYMPMAARQDGYALSQAVKDKKKRYPDKSGLRVTVAAVESFGRLGDEFSALINDLSFAARQWQWSRGLQASPWSKKWRGSISAVLARGTAKAIKEALHGNGTVSNNQRRCEQTTCSDISSKTLRPLDP